MTARTAEPSFAIGPVYPVPNADAEDIASKWLPTFVDPGRVPTYPPGTTSPISIFDPLHSEPDLQGWIPSFAQPSRATSPRDGTVTVGPTPDASSSSLDRTAPTYINPPRKAVFTPTEAYAAPPLGSYVPTPDAWIGTASGPTYPTPSASSYLAFAAGFSDDTTTDGSKWQPTIVQPSRERVRDQVQAYAESPSADVPAFEPVILGPPRPSASRDVPAGGTVVNPPDPMVVVEYAQPSRPTPIARGLPEVSAPVSVDAESVTSDRWAPTVVQPGRVPARTGGEFATSFEFPPGPETVTWWPTTADPSRGMARSAEGFGVLAPVQPDPALLWLMPDQPQPYRVPSYASGSIDAAPVSTDVEVVTVDRWSPSFAQARRIIERASGTTIVSATFYGGGRPDPFRGTSAPSGPNAESASVIRAKVVRT